MSMISLVFFFFGIFSLGVPRLYLISEKKAGKMGEKHQTGRRVLERITKWLQIRKQAGERNETKQC